MADYLKAGDLSRIPAQYSGRSGIVLPIAILNQNKIYNDIICGYRAKRWAVVIALSQMLFAVSIFVFAIVSLSKDRGKSSEPTASTATWSHSKYPELDKEKVTYWNFISDPNWQLLYGLSGFFQGSVLLAGVQYENLIFLAIWFIASGFTLMFFLSLLILPLFMFVRGGRTFYLMVFFVILIKCGVEAFSFSVVSMYRQELMGLLIRLHPQHKLDDSSREDSSEEDKNGFKRF